MQEQSNFDPNMISGGMVSTMKNKDPIPCSGSYFCWEKYTSNKRSSFTLFADNCCQNHQWTLGIDVLCNLCYGSIALQRNDKRTLVQSYSQTQHSNFSSGKRRSAGQIASLSDMPACYFKNSVMTREIRLRVYKQNDWRRTKKVPIDFFNIKHNIENIQAMDGPNNLLQNFQQTILI